MRRSPAAKRSRSAARASSTCRAVAAAWRSGFAVTWMVSLAIVGPWLGVRAVSPRNHGHAVEGDIEFLGDDLAKRGADAGAEIDMAVEGGDPAIAADDDEDLDRLGAILDDQQLVRTIQIILRGGCGHADAAARTAARMISTCVPQRQRL